MSPSTLEAGDAHPATDAHGGNDLPNAAALALDEGVADQSRAGHATGVTNSNGSAVDIHSLVREPSRSRQ